jgi:glyoxylase-like metal-dependent hydrolase (beta-lactamase superfamily II)
MSLVVETFALGPLETNCFVLRRGRSCWIVDPGMWPETLLESLGAAGTQVQKILLTHAHGDHIASVSQLKDTFSQAAFCCPAGEIELLGDPSLNMSMAFGVRITAPDADRALAPGDELTGPEGTWHVLDTAGHSPAGVSFYCPGERIVLTGDALFHGSIGRTDIPGADHARLLDNIRRNLLTLPDETRVLAGHGPPTTIGREKRENPFLRD